MGIRTKLMLVSLLFMAIPLLGYEFVLDMTKLLQQGLNKALMLEAQAIASVLHERGELFDPKTGIPLNKENQWNLYAQPTYNEIEIDGDSKDWVSIIQKARFFGAKHVLSDAKAESEKDISFWHVISYDESYLYCLFQVHDDKLMVDNENVITDNDHLRVYLRKNNRIDRLLFMSDGYELMQVYSMLEDWKTPYSAEDEEKFHAKLMPNKNGYNIELRMPLDLVVDSGYIGFALVDVDEVKSLGSSVPNVVVSTINPSKMTELNRIFLRSPQIEKILKGLDRSSGRIWVVDQHQRVRAVAGSFESKDMPPAETSFFDPVYNFLLRKISREFKDLSSNVTRLTNEAISSAVAGSAQNFKRPSTDNKATIIGAAYPIEIGNRSIGAVVVEQSTNDILATQNKAIKSIVQRLSLIFIIAVATLLWFATHLAMRIKRLNEETSRAIDEKGRIVVEQGISGVRNKDELGNLSSSIAQMLQRLRQHTTYLERMPRTLRHEILNPLNVLNISVENLEREIKPNSQVQKYIKSTKNGVKRLASILQSLTEASSLDDALESDVKELFDLNELLHEYMDNYREFRSAQAFELHLPPEPVVIFGLPDYIAQMLDKIIDNAIDFTENDQPIIINLNLDKTKKEACIGIINQGTQIPEEIRQNLFESMVSIRPDSKRSVPHLGIGLYVARYIAEAHDGNIKVRNIDTPQGVGFLICLPTDPEPH